MSERDSKTQEWTERQVVSDDLEARKQELDPPYYEEGPLLPDGQQPLEPPFYEPEPPPPPKAPEERE